MKQPVNTRAQQTRQRLRETAKALFLQQGYQATSVDTILAAAGIASRETFYRHYAGKEEFFVDVLSHLTMEQPRFSERVAALPPVRDLATLRQALTTLARELQSVMSQPEYQALMRITIAEGPRFPQLGPLYFAAIPQHVLSLIMAQLHEAREQEIIADVDFEALARALLGGLLSYAIQSLLLMGEQTRPPSLDRADALVEVMMRALKR
jgi:AcrR family transcriptional regulator